VYGLLFLTAAGIPYFFYLAGITWGKTQGPAPVPEKYPPVSIVLSALNESKNVERRIKNLADCDYPADLEIVFVDDGSTDNTKELAKEYLDKYFFDYQLVVNPKRLGTVISYAKAIRLAKNDIVLVTDADVEFKPDAIEKIINRLLSQRDIAAVTGDLQPIPTKDTTAAMEGEYRNIYGRMGDWESANGSTINFNGALMAFRKDIINKVSEKGADDINIASAAVRNGYRAVYEKEAVVYESIPLDIEIQFKQKSRRATQLIDSMIANKDVLVTNRFYLMRAWMVFASPILFILGTLFLLTNFIFLVLLVIGIILSGFIQAFIFNQFALFIGLLNYGTDLRAWDSTTSLQVKV
jgi:cellulose synthase/poly-beta-1,6-N-acetylglucosamine synthase-like glycosyltransferase